MQCPRCQRVWKKTTDLVVCRCQAVLVLAQGKCVALTEFEIEALRVESLFARLDV